MQYTSSITFIAQLMGLSWGALAGAFLAPFLYGLYWKRATAAGAWASFIFGAGIMILNMAAPQLFPAFLQSPINCGAMAMVAGLIIVPLVSLVTRAPDKEFIDDSFSCYDIPVTTHMKSYLGD